MKTSDYIRGKIKRLPKGYVFTYDDFTSKVNKKEAVIKTLNRLAASGSISKLAKGKYFKAEQTVFGELEPSVFQIVKDLLEVNGKITGYLTGYSIYNQLGLTTQVSTIIQIGKNEFRPFLKRGKYTLLFVKQKNTITKENIPLLQLLDALRYIKKIPDASIDFLYNRFYALLTKLNNQEKGTLVRLALKYPPSTRALLGSFLEDLGDLEVAIPLRKSLNPITKYKLAGINKVLSTAINWNFE